jgi:hypothetical protein
LELGVETAASTWILGSQQWRSVRTRAAETLLPGWVVTMDFDDKCRAWFRSLPDELRAEVRGTVGLIPEWMVVSLERANIPVVPVELPGGNTESAYLMPTPLILFLADLER